VLHRLRAHLQLLQPRSPTFYHHINSRRSSSSRILFPQLSIAHLLCGCDSAIAAATNDASSAAMRSSLAVLARRMNARAFVFDAATLRLQSAARTARKQRVSPSEWVTASAGTSASAAKLATAASSASPSSRRASDNGIAPLSKLIGAPSDGATETRAVSAPPTSGLWSWAFSADAVRGATHLSSSALSSGLKSAASKPAPAPLSPPVSQSPSPPSAALLDAVAVRNASADDAKVAFAALTAAVGFEAPPPCPRASEEGAFHFTVSDCIQIVFSLQAFMMFVLLHHQTCGEHGSHGCATRGMARCTHRYC
jgi:hypothetical protein